jgi:hypothetical protein
MTIPNLSCDLFADRLADLLEHDVDDTTRASMEAHALGCADCGPLLADLRRLRIEAANLPELSPSADLWAGISERIQTPVVALGAGARADGTVERWNAGTVRRVAPLWIGLAAAGLVAITATVTHEMTRRGLQPAASIQVAAIDAKAPVAAEPSSDSTAAKPAALGTVPPKTRQLSVPPFHRSTVPPAALVSNRPTAQQTYETEISNLRTVLQRRRPDLDSSTVAIVEHNLHVIDDAITQCKQALRKDPASRFLMESLNDAMDNKVQLLRTAAALPSKS